MGFDLQPTDEQAALKSTLHDFAEAVLRPAGRDCEAARSVSPAIVRALHELGIAAPVAEEYGGGGLPDAVTHCIAAEEVAWGNPGIAYQALASGVAAVMVGVAGSDEQKARLLPPLAEADDPATFVAIAEKVAISDLASLDATVDGGKVSGNKYGVVNAAKPRWGVVVGRAGDSIAAVIVEPGTGVEVLRPEDKVGLEAAPTWVVRFDAAGEPLPPGPNLWRALLWTRLINGAVALGCARAAFEHAAAYAVERTAFGKPIGAFQAISFKIADMATLVDAARVAVWRAAWLIDRGEATLEDVVAANGQATAAAVQCGDDAVQILGGHGYMRDHPVEMWFRDAVTLSVLDAPAALGDALVARRAEGV